MNKRTYTTKALALLLSLMMVLGAFAGCGDPKPAGSQPAGSQATGSQASQTSSQTDGSDSSAEESTQAASTAAGTKTITFQVVHKDGSAKDFTIETEADNLRAALEQEKLIEGEESEYGLYVKTVDGETVDDANEEWWCLTDKDGNMTPTGVDDTKIANGDAYTFTFTVGYDS